MKNCREFGPLKRTDKELQRAVAGLAAVGVIIGAAREISGLNAFADDLNNRLDKGNVSAIWPSFGLIQPGSSVGKPRIGVPMDKSI